MDENVPAPGPSKPRPEHLGLYSNGGTGTPVPIVPFHASVRFSSSSQPDLEVTVPNVNESPLPTIATLKQQIRFLRPVETHNRRLRLILAGKVLNDQALLKAIQKQHSRRRQSIPAVTPSVKGKEREPVPDRLWIHCSMGEPLSDEEFEEEEREKQVQSTLPLPLGFDRLRSAGFSDEDIASLRLQFQRFHGSRGDEADNVDLTLMEERWLDETIGLGAGATPGDGGIYLDVSVLRIAPSDSYEETLFGFIIGYFAVNYHMTSHTDLKGLFALFFIWEPSIGISRNLKQAIIAGVVLLCTLLTRS
jgi:hypothetical protein